jgi:hypothetical protein
MYFKNKSIAELKSLLENSKCEQPFKSKNKTMLVHLAVNMSSIVIPGEEDNDSDICSELSCATIGFFPPDPADVNTEVDEVVAPSSKCESITGNPTVAHSEPRNSPLSLVLVDNDIINHTLESGSIASNKDEEVIRVHNAL